MRTMKFLSLIAAAIMLFSCSNESVDPALEVVTEALNDSESFILEESGFTITEVEALDGAYDDMYTEGALQYEKDGKVLAIVDFGNGTYENMARLISNGEVSDINLDEHPHGHPTNDCFRFVFPITFILPDGSEVTGNSKQELRDAIKAWYEDHPDAEGRPKIKFPVEIELKNGEIKTLENGHDLKRAIEFCKDRQHNNQCDGKRFVRRVVEPIVKTEDCGREPVSGIVKYFSCRTHDWVATIDFGDGACDDLATLITRNGVKEIVISEWMN